MCRESAPQVAPHRCILKSFRALGRPFRTHRRCTARHVGGLGMILQLNAGMDDAGADASPFKVSSSAPVTRQDTWRLWDMDYKSLLKERARMGQDNYE